ncbi:hypothetical protein MC7420_4308 [Coleofasciculus chthonoplastes PCC 7420]|uniref:Uncharacterized protein n=1 Tax=Coleofasciculus chthonoplastes PCC 7420 TaxID=118168 RepID=B4W403_9CYAN|nr:hypothetical protein MC7420_4308 [Coleofasciculus chthonoplastes PCC 7420]
MNKRHPSDVLMLLTHLSKSATINKIVQNSSFAIAPCLPPFLG